jgi:hypothetical protein
MRSLVINAEELALALHPLAALQIPDCVLDEMRKARRHHGKPSEDGSKISLIVRAGQAAVLSVARSSRLAAAKSSLTNIFRLQFRERR